jgi:macrolide transport system ATP-binding/permease protein
LLRLRALRRDFPAGDDTITVLDDVNLDIHAGEMVAIVGQSGSGKSTLMNILGCLDQPSAGSYQVAGRETGNWIRTNWRSCGASTSASSSSAITCCRPGRRRQRGSAGGLCRRPAQRRARAAQLLARLGLADRSHHKPGKLSGGQQQRVSIARALMNGGDVILADEPTGRAGQPQRQEVMNILGELHAEGHTIIIVTHDMQVASTPSASSRSGWRDRRRPPQRPDRPHRRRRQPQQRQASSWRPRWTASGSLRMALLAMNAHRLRTFLTMLGIIIGIASVVSVVALGSGSQQILADISAMGTNTIDIFPGPASATCVGRHPTLTPADADALAEQSFVDSVTPSVSTASSARYGNISVSATSMAWASSTSACAA